LAVGFEMLLDLFSVGHNERKNDDWFFIFYIRLPQGCMRSFIHLQHNLAFSSSYSRQEITKLGDRNAFIVVSLPHDKDR
jgi:hypothetical protein